MKDSKIPKTIGVHLLYKIKKVTFEEDDLYDDVKCNNNENDSEAESEKENEKETEKDIKKEKKKKSVKPVKKMDFSKRLKF